MSTVTCGDSAGNPEPEGRHPGMHRGRQRIIATDAVAHDANLQHEHSFVRQAHGQLFLYVKHITKQNVVDESKRFPYYLIVDYKRTMKRTVYTWVD